MSSGPFFRIASQALMQKSAPKGHTPASRLGSLSIFTTSLVLGVWAKPGCTAAMRIHHQLMDYIF